MGVPGEGGGIVYGDVAGLLVGLSGFVSFFEWRICVGSVPDGDAIKKFYGILG